MSWFPDSVVRVIRNSGNSASTFYWGMGLRFFERVLSITPYFLAYVWFQYVFLVDGAASNLLMMLTQMQAAVLFVFLLAVQLAGQLLFSYFGQLKGFIGAYELTQGYRERIIDHVRLLPLGVSRREHSGRLASIVTDDVNRVEKIFTHLVTELVTSLTVPLLFVLALAWIDWRLALVLVVTMPLALLVLILPSRLFLSKVGKKQEQLLDLSGQLVEFVGGIRTMRLFNRASDRLRQLDQRFSELRDMSIDAEAWGGGPVHAYRLILELGAVALLIAAAYLAVGEMLFPLHWLLFAMVFYKLIDPLMEAAAYWTELRAMLQAEGRIQHLLDEPVVNDSPERVQLETYEVKFEQVGFHYNVSKGGREDNSWALREASFTAPQGKITAIVGPSGSGKSTALHLLARFFDPCEGRLTLGGVDVRNMPLDQLYDSLSFVFQEVQLFDDTILENVRIGRPEASDGEVIAACRAAFCDQFVQYLDDGYSTKIGEDGARLSGGERQRISIARALLKDAPVLLLDEATASVDPEAQYEIQKALSQLVKNRTVIMIAHRLSTIRYADQILVLKKGRLIEQGRHDHLIAAGGLYRDLWNAQTGK